MKPTEVERLVKKLHVKPSAEMYSKTLTDTLEAQKQKVYEKKLVTLRRKYGDLLRRQ